MDWDIVSINILLHFNYKIDTGEGRIKSKTSDEKINIFNHLSYKSLALLHFNECFDIVQKS